jgi:hypothetical protein
VARPYSAPCRADLALAVGLARDHGPRPLLADQRPRVIGVISLVTEEVLSAFEMSEKFGRRGDVVDVAGSEQEAEWATDYIGEGVNFRGISAAR